MIGMNNNRNPIQGEFADKLREEIDNKVSEEDIKKMSEASKDLFGFDMFDTTKNNKEEMLGEPDCAEEQPSKIEVTVLEALQMQVKDYKDRYLRALADYQNLLKRSDKEFSNGWYNGQNKIIEELIPFFDDFDRLVENVSDQIGANYVRSTLERSLKTNNISVINPNEGDVFDENFHDAIMVVPTMHKNLDNHVKAVFTKGYKHNDYVIRYAGVSVYKYQEQ